MITYYILLLLGFATAIGCLTAKIREGYVPLGLAIAGCSFFIDSPVSWGFVVLGIITTLLTFRKTE